MTETATVADAIRLGAERLEPVAENPRLEARLLLAHALHVSTADLIRDPRAIVPVAAYQALIGRRQAHEPLAYLTGRREFWSLDLAVSPATLIPRPDSETVVAVALRAGAQPARVLDLGTGTGCLLLAVLSECPNAFGIGVDRSAAAVLMARRNAARCGLSGRAVFLRGDWTTAIAGCFDLVVSNPPYIPASDIAALMPEVALHEPMAALDGGTDGLDAYRRIIPALPGLLTSAGRAVLEIGIGQSAAIEAFAHAAGLQVEIHPDLANIPRAALLRRASR